MPGRRAFPLGNPPEGSKRENKKGGGIASPFPRSAAVFPGKAEPPAAL